MAIEKVKGIETEWGIGVKSKCSFKPAEIQHFQRMINIVKDFFEMSADSTERAIYEIENLDRIDRSYHLSRNSRFHHNLLPNGSRLYIDGPHLEYSTPECISAKTLVAADMAGEAIVDMAKSILNEKLARDGKELIVYKDNTDRSGNAYGCHENYLVLREAFDRITSLRSLEAGYLASFFICRIIFTGAGKMGVEDVWEKKRIGHSVFQISQRADFMQVISSNDTMVKRGILNTRNEALADENRFGRLHVIVGDANLAEVANYMKVGITSIVLKMIEDGFLKGDLAVTDPVSSIKLVSKDLTCREPLLETTGGRRISSLDLSEEFFQLAREYFSRVVEPTAEEEDLLRLWEETNNDFRTDNKGRLRRRFDWQTKLGLFQDFLEDLGVPWKDIKKREFKDGRRRLKIDTFLHLKDILYHRMDKEKGLYWGCKEDGDVEEIIDREQILELMKNPPPECRSYFRGRCISELFSEIETVDWHEIVFKAKQKRRRNFFLFFAEPRIALGNPAWGGRKDVERILNQAENAEELIELLKEVPDV